MRALSENWKNPDFLWFRCVIFPFCVVTTPRKERTILVQTPDPFSDVRRMTTVARQLRREMTPAERLLWQALRANRLDGFHFRRQHPIGPFILDFYCHAARLAIEIDGGHHLADPQVIQRDRERSEALRANGLRVMRFRNEDLLTRTEEVLVVISRALHRRSPLPQPLPTKGGEGSRKEVDTTPDQELITSDQQPGASTEVTYAVRALAPLPTLGGEGWGEGPL